MKDVAMGMFVGLSLPVFIDPTLDKRLPLFIILGLISAGCVISAYNEWKDKDK